MHSVNLHDKKDAFKASPEELRVIQEKMKDPEFMKLFAEYTQSLADPKYREEEEAYLRQVEQEARVGGDQSFDFVFPKPCFAVELLQPDSKGKSKKAFINICSSDKIDCYEEQTTGNRMGSNWHVPVSVSDARQEEYEGKKVDVFDAVYHPKTVAISDRSDKFMCFLVEIAVENLNAGYQRQFGFEFRRLSSQIQSIGQPKNQTVRRKAGESAFPKDNSASASLGPIKVKPEPKGNNEAPRPAASSTTKKEGSSSSSSPSRNAAVSAPAIPKENLPKMSIAHRGEIDLTDAWNWKVSDKRIGIPKELVVKMELSGVKSASVLDIDVAESYITIAKSTAHPYHGMLALPFSVDSVPASAKFEKSKGVITLVLKVVPPPAPPSSAAPEESKETQPEPETTAEEEKPEPKPKEEATTTITGTASSPSKSAADDESAVAPPVREEAKAVEPPANPSVADALKELEEEEAAVKAKTTKRSEDKAPQQQHVDPVPSPNKQKSQNQPSVTGLEPSSLSAPATNSDSSPSKCSSGADADNAADSPSGGKFDHLDHDRAAKLREILAKAKQEREEAESKEEEITGRRLSREPTPQTTPSKSQTHQKSEEATASPPPPPQPQWGDDAPEVVDLTKRQQEWMEGVQKTKHEEELRQMLEDQEAELKKQLEREEKEQEAEREAKRIAKEQRKKMEAEKEAERLEALLVAKRLELPLKSHHILAIN